jgi:hypothetical protein
MFCGGAHNIASITYNVFFLRCPQLVPREKFSLQKSRRSKELVSKRKRLADKLKYFPNTATVRTGISQVLANLQTLTRILTTYFLFYRGKTVF